MRKLLSILALLLAVPCHATVTYVQSTISSPATSSTVTLAYPSNVTSGNLLISYISNFNTAGPSAVTDTQSNTWTRVHTYNLNGGAVVTLFVTYASSTGADTLTTSGFNANNANWVILEYSGASALSVMMGGAGGITSSTSLVVTSAATGTAGSVARSFTGRVLSIFADVSASHTFTNASVSIRQQGTYAGGGGTVVGDQALSSTSITYAVPYTTTYTASAAAFGTSDLLFIYEAGGGGTTVQGNYGSSN